MPVAKLTSKGRITLPNDIRVALGVQSGDQLAFTVHRDGSITVVAKTVDIRSLRGALKSPVRGVRVPTMREAMRQSASRNT